MHDTPIFCRHCGKALMEVSNYRPGMYDPLTGVPPPAVMARSCPDAPPFSSSSFSRHDRWVWHWYAFRRLFGGRWIDYDQVE